MANRGRRNFSNARKRPTKWCSAAFDFPVPSSPALAAADGVNLCVGTNADADMADPVVGWCRGGLSISRVGAAVDNPAVAWCIAMSRTDPGSTTALQVINPWNASDMERQDILGWGICDVPPLGLNSADALVDLRGSLTTVVHVKTSRKYPRNSNQLTLWVAAIGGTDNNYQVSGVIRTLMKF